MLEEFKERARDWFARRIEASRPVSLALHGLATEHAASEYYARHGFRGLSAAYDSAVPTWSGERVSLDSALNHSVVFTCKRILAESTGFLPLSMMRRKEGEKLDAVEHPMYAALHDAPNDEITAQRFRETITGHIALGGNGYARILRRSGTGVANELIILLPSQVTPDRERTKARRLVYVVKDAFFGEKTYTVERGKPHDILHIPGIGWDGLRGYSVLKLARQSIGTANAAERHVGRFYANGGRLPYYLKLDRSFDNDEDFKKFRADWEAIYAEPHRAPMLEPYIAEYKQIGVSAVDAQMLETRQFTVSEICRWFRISPHMAGDLANANNSITEQLALEFVTFTLHPWLKRWEQELWRCVLTSEEKEQGYYWHHNVNALLRGAFKTRMEGYSIALQNGFMSQNEVRDLEDRNGFEGGDDYHIQLNMQTLPAAPVEGSQQQGGQGSLVKIGNGKKNRRVA
jgi:HK97 family phage portal protein